MRERILMPWSFSNPRKFTPSATNCIGSACGNTGTPVRDHMVPCVFFVLSGGVDLWLSQTDKIRDVKGVAAGGQVFAPCAPLLQSRVFQNRSEAMVLGSSYKINLLILHAARQRGATLCFVCFHLLGPDLPCWWWAGEYAHLPRAWMREDIRNRSCECIIGFLYYNRGSSLFQSIVKLLNHLEFLLWAGLICSWCPLINVTCWRPLWLL